MLGILIRIRPKLRFDKFLEASTVKAILQLVFTPSCVKLLDTDTCPLLPKLLVCIP